MPKHDPKRYYRILGVPTSASDGEIRTSFRALAKLFHPDRSSDPNAARKFQVIHEAYEVLGNAERRARYDDLPYEPKPHEQRFRTSGPIVCSNCGRITAQPRYVIYHYVLSAIQTFIRPVQGIFCVACAKRKGLEASAISALAGWWGIFGPIDTVRTIIRNARGGEQPREFNDRLLWANARAFLGTGRPELSYALAQELLTSKTDNIASAARHLIESLKAQGVKDGPQLKHQWQFSPGAAFLHFILLLAIPSAIIAYIPPEPLIQSIINLPATISGQNRADPNICSEPPQTGQVLEDHTNWFLNVNALEIQNRSGHDAIVKIRSSASGRMLISFFVANNATARFDRIPDGTYRIQYAFGKTLDRYCATFLDQLVAAEIPDAETFVTSFAGLEINHQVLSYTLQSVPAGKTYPDSIDASAFNAP
ncbi:MAG TPA: J domain-containing protein [Rhizomicrobium sp.]|jgi:hypothetical protein